MPGCGVRQAKDRRGKDGRDGPCIRAAWNVTMPINQILGRSYMKRALVAISLVAVVSTVVSAQEPTVLPQADAAKYAPAPFPPGAQQAIIVGNPKNAEGYVIRVKLAKGTKVAPHMHPNDENVTVISGTFHIGVGEKFDEAKGQTVKAGGYVNVPKGKASFRVGQRGQRYPAAWRRAGRRNVCQSSRRPEVSGIGCWTLACSERAGVTSVTKHLSPCARSRVPGVRASFSTKSRAASQGCRSVRPLPWKQGFHPSA